MQSTWVYTMSSIICLLPAPMPESCLWTLIQSLASQLHSKLRQVRLDPIICQWIVDFLTDRRQFVRLGPYQSQPLYKKSWETHHVPLTPRELPVTETSIRERVILHKNQYNMVIFTRYSVDSVLIFLYFMWTWLCLVLYYRSLYSICDI